MRAREGILSQSDVEVELTESDYELVVPVTTGNLG